MCQPLDIFRKGRVQQPDIPRCALWLCPVAQLHQQSVLSGRQLPYDPMQHFAALLPVATQDALEAAAAAAAGAGASPAAQQQQQAARAAGPVALLGEATAPLLGTEELAAVPSSSDAKRAGGYPSANRPPTQLVQHTAVQASAVMRWCQFHLVDMAARACTSAATLCPARLLRPFVPVVPLVGVLLLIELCGCLACGLRPGRGRQQRERPAAVPKSASQPAASPSAAAAVAAAAAPAAAAASAGDAGVGADGANASRKPRCVHRGLVHVVCKQRCCS
jgi:hypothetical protein